MINNVTTFRTNSVKDKDEANLLVIRRLKECLKMAEEENILNCAIVLIDDDNRIIDCWADSGAHPFLMFAALNSLALEFRDSAIDQRKHHD